MQVMGSHGATGFPYVWGVGPVVVTGITEPHRYPNWVSRVDPLEYPHFSIRGPHFPATAMLDDPGV